MSEVLQFLQKRVAPLALVGGLALGACSKGEGHEEVMLPPATPETTLFMGPPTSPTIETTTTTLLRSRAKVPVASINDLPTEQELGQKAYTYKGWYRTPLGTCVLGIGQYDPATNQPPKPKGC